jgi:hypothetical protein
LKCRTIYWETREVARTKATKKKKAKPKKENAIVRYLRETRAELRKVHWPTRQEAWNLDYLFSLELREFIAGSALAIGIMVVGLVAGILAAVLINRQTAR